MATTLAQKRFNKPGEEQLFKQDYSILRNEDSRLQHIRKEKVTDSSPSNSVYRISSFKLLVCPPCLDLKRDPEMLFPTVGGQEVWMLTAPSEDYQMCVCPVPQNTPQCQDHN